MRFTLAALVATSLLFLLQPPSLPAQGHRCARCKDEGLIPCKSKEHSHKKVCGYTWDHKCTAIYDARCCRGTELVPCPNKSCNQPVALLKHEEELAQRKAWVDRMRLIDKKTGFRFEHVETDGWVLHSSIPRIKIKDRSLRKVKTAHRFMDILLRTARRFQEITGVLPGPKQEVFLVPDERQNLTVTLHYFGVGHKVAYKIYSTQSKVCSWPRPPELKSDTAFAAHVCHLAAHQLTQSSVAFKRNLAGWIDVGMAHWLELDLMKEKSTFCFKEVNSNGKNRWEGGKWKKMIHSEVRKRNEALFADISRRDVDNLDHRAHAYCWSYVDFLVRKHPDEFKKLFRKIKQTNDTKAALDAALSWSTTGFQKEWRRFVLKEYQPK